MMRKIFVTICVLLMAVLGLPKPALADPAAAVSLALSPDGTVTSPVNVYLVAKNEDTASVSITGVSTEITIDSTKLSASVDTSYKPISDWVWTPDTGVSGNTIKISGSTATQIDIAAGATVQVAKLVFTLSANTTTTISTNPAVSIVTQKTTGANVFDDITTDAGQPQSYTLTGVTFATTVQTTAAVTAATTAPTAISGTGPADTIVGSVVVALSAVSGFFFFRRARKAWKLSKL